MYMPIRAFIFRFELMTITEKYIEIIKPSLSPCQKKKFKDGTWVGSSALPTPFLSHIAYERLRDVA